MKIKLKKLCLLNFKGIRNLEVEFDEETNIFGQNRLGKTTILDAWWWLLFGKNSADKSDFELKTLDENNKAYPRIDHEVTGFLIVNGLPTTLKKSFKENWVKKTGSAVPEFTGHSTTYYWNDVPMKEKEYSEKINGILKESAFKLITNTAYFNQMKKEERRNVLLQLAGNITDADVLEKIATIDNKDQVFNLTNILNAGKSVAEYLQEIGSKKTIIKKNLLLIPSRIDEASRSLPDLADYTSLETDLSYQKMNLEKVEKKINDKTIQVKEYHELINKKVMEAGQLKQKRTELEFSIKNKVRDKKLQRENIIAEKRRMKQASSDEMTRHNSDLLSKTKTKTLLQQRKADLTSAWNKENKSVPVINTDFSFDPEAFVCPSCKRPFENVDIESKKAELQKNFNDNVAKLQADFNTEKARKLKEITDQGKKTNDEINIMTNVETDLQLKISGLQATINALASEIAELEYNHNKLCNDEELEVTRAIVADQAHQELTKKINSLEAEVDTPQSAFNNSDLLLEKRTIIEKIELINASLSSKEQRAKQLRRIDELTAEETKMANELAELEGIEFFIEGFNKAKMAELENRINGKFRLVKFRLFDQQINGSEKPDCETLVNGVPFPDVNTADKINAGLDIINVLSRHFDTYAPIFVDNAESVNTLLPVGSQLIRLVVSLDKKLKVERKGAELFPSA